MIQLQVRVSGKGTLCQMHLIVHDKGVQFIQSNELLLVSRPVNGREQCFGYQFTTFGKFVICRTEFRLYAFFLFNTHKPVAWVLSRLWCNHLGKLASKSWNLIFLNFPEANHLIVGYVLRYLCHQLDADAVTHFTGLFANISSLHILKRINCRMCCVQYVWHHPILSFLPFENNTAVFFFPKLTCQP